MKTYSIKIVPVAYSKDSVAQFRSTCDENLPQELKHPPGGWPGKVPTKDRKRAMAWAEQEYAGAFDYVI